MSCVKRQRDSLKRSLSYMTSTGEVKQMWGAVVLSVIISFGAFLITFAAVAVGMALEGIGDKISEILAS